jgi:Ca2+-binding EF-hand superfamily protein
MLKNMFSGGTGTGTDAFVQSRGDEQRFAELDVDGDGQISAAEFGIGATGSTDPAQDTEVADAGAETNEEAVTTAQDNTSEAPLDEATMKSLVGAVDRNADGRLSNGELAAFVTQFSTQMGAASKKYSDTAVSSFSTRQASRAA